MRYETGIRSHAELALALWARGWPVDAEVVRDAYGRCLAPLVELANAERRADFADRAARKGKLPPRWRRGRAPRVALGLDAMFALMSGARRVSPDDLDDLAYLEHVSGLARARRDRVDGVGPWLPTAPGVGLAEGAHGMAAPRLLSAIHRATPADLAIARDIAAALDERLTILLPMMQLGFGSDFAGLGGIADVAGDPRLRIWLALAALLLPEEAEALLNGLPRGAQLAEVVDALDAGQRMIDEDEQLATRTAAVGLVAALEERSATTDEVNP